MLDIVGLIPARGGSKGVPRKNLRLLGGKPLIAWTIEAALTSGRLRQVIVSTDDAEIADVARRYGAEVPFIRPAKFAEDSSTQYDVIDHLLQWQSETGAQKSEFLMLLQPTSPFRDSRDIQNAVDIAKKKDARSVISVCEPHHHPCFCKRLKEDGTLGHFLPDGKVIHRRQDVPLAYALNGGIFLTHIATFQKERTLEPDHALPYVMPEDRSFEIDNIWELQVADLIATNLINKSK